MPPWLWYNYGMEASMTKISVRLPDDLMKRIRRTKPEHLSANAWIVDLLNTALGRVRT